MLNLKSEETGRRLTKYECRLAFYDFSKIQGRFFGWLIKACGFSHITHVAPVILLPNGKEIVLTVCSAKHIDGKFIPSTRIHTLNQLEQLGVKLIDLIPIEPKVIDLNEMILLVDHYSDTNAWDVIFHTFIGQFLGLTRPRACSSLACQLFNLQEEWHPAKLYRKLTQ